MNLSVQNANLQTGSPIKRLLGCGQSMEKGIYFLPLSFRDTAL